MGASTSWNPQGLCRPVMGLLYLSHHLFTLYFNLCFFRTESQQIRTGSTQYYAVVSSGIHSSAPSPANIVSRTLFSTSTKNNVNTCQESVLCFFTNTTTLLLQHASQEGTMHCDVYLCPALSQTTFTCHELSPVTTTRHSR